MKTAEYIKDIEGWTGDARLYRLSEPLEKNDYVIVSSTVAMFSGPETYIFGADEKGEIENFGELNGSYKGELDHIRALNNAGYTVTNQRGESK